MRDSDRQIVDEPRHALRLLAHDPQEALARLGIVARRTLQRLDEAQQRGERRAQLVTGVGDEVGAHAFDAPRLGQVAQRDDRGGRISFDAKRRDQRLEPAFDGQPLDPQRLFGASALEHPAERVQHIGRAQASRQRLALAQRRQAARARRVGGGDALAHVDEEDRLRQRVDQRAQRRVFLKGLGVPLRRDRPLAERIEPHDGPFRAQQPDG